MTKTATTKPKRKVDIFEDNQLQQPIGRRTELNDEQEISQLKEGMNFRDPKYRREVFLRFYQFHLKYNAHPGGVYYALPWLVNHYNMNVEQKYWMGFINGCSQNIVTTWLIMKMYPTLESVNIEQLKDWWSKSQSIFKINDGWDLDRRHHRYSFPLAVQKYKNIIYPYGNQQNFFKEFTPSSDPLQNFRPLWDFVLKNFKSFGRLSTFSYLEYMKILGVNIDCDNLFMEDIKGSQSHRNGLSKVLGRDDLDWWDHKQSHNPDFPGYNRQTMNWLIVEADLLLQEAKERFKHNKEIPQQHVNFFTLESTLCCYKSWHRPNRRYPNVYNDMFYERIKYAESAWPDVDFSIFWQMRRESLPEKLLLEANQNDPGIVSQKQNHYRETGQVIMMDDQYEEFKNDFNDKYYK